MWSSVVEASQRAIAHLRERWQLSCKACNCSFVSFSVFVIRKGIKPVPKGVTVSEKSDSYLFAEGKQKLSG
jgi:hypothetical protein